MKKNKISFISAETVLSWSNGEVLNPETICWRTNIPWKEGLFCPKIFGYEKELRDKCGVGVKGFLVEEKKFGHISLVVPVINPFLLKDNFSKLSSLLNVSVEELNGILTSSLCVVANKGTTNLVTGQLLEQDKVEQYKCLYGKEFFEVETGLNAIKKLISYKIDSSEALINVIPVIPPTFRPMIRVDKKYLVSDLNDIYRQIITCNNRLKKLLENKAKQDVIQEELTMLQKAVNDLYNKKIFLNVLEKKIKEQW